MRDIEIINDFTCEKCGGQKKLHLISRPGGPPGNMLVCDCELQGSKLIRKPGDAPQVGASPENRDRVLKEIDQRKR